MYYYYYIYIYIFNYVVNLNVHHNYHALNDILQAAESAGKTTPVSESKSGKTKSARKSIAGGVKRSTPKKESKSPLTPKPTLPPEDTLNKHLLILDGLPCHNSYAYIYVTVCMDQ